MLVRLGEIRARNKQIKSPLAEDCSAKDCYGSDSASGVE